MWLTLTLLLVALWVLGMVSGATLGWWIHLLLLFAVISLILSVVQTRRAT